MSDAYDVQSFEPDYCRGDLLKIAAAIKSKASLLVIGMPGCGKSRLINFLLHRPDVQQQYGLPEPERLKFVRIDGDMVLDAQGMYLELLRAVDSEGQVPANSVDLLKNQIVAAVRNMDQTVDLVIVFDNFVQSLQGTLGQSFFNFLFALRNMRPRLNLVYIFMTNFKIDLAGFFKLDRLFDRGVDRSICWLSLLNQQDIFFSINRQLHKAGRRPEALSRAQKQHIYLLGGGHPLLNRYLTHLFLSGEIDLQTEPDQILHHGGIQAACAAIWRDLAQPHRNYLVDLATGHSPALKSDPQTIGLLQDYGVLTAPDRFFSPLFEQFARTQEKSSAVIDVQCDDLQTTVTVRTVDEERSFVIQGLSKRKRKLLCYLIDNQGETCPKDQLINAGWPEAESEGVSDRALSGQIDGLRAWLKESALNRYLAVETDWGLGYQVVFRE